MRHHVKTRPLDRIDIVVFQIKFNVINSRNRIFNVFSYVVRFSLSCLWLLVYNKILIDCVLRKQYTLSMMGQNDCHAVLTLIFLKKCLLPWHRKNCCKACWWSLLWCQLCTSSPWELSAHSTGSWKVQPPPLSFKDYHLSSFNHDPWFICSEGSLSASSYCHDVFMFSTRHSTWTLLVYRCI